MSQQSTNKPTLFSNVIQMAQLATLVVGLILVAASMGAKGEKLDQHDLSLKELKTITTDLVRSQIGFSIDITNQKQQLTDLEARMRSMESRK